MCEIRCLHPYQRIQRSNSTYKSLLKTQLQIWAALNGTISAADCAEKAVHILEVTDGLPDVGAALTCRPHSSLLLVMEDLEASKGSGSSCREMLFLTKRGGKKILKKLCFLCVLEADYYFHVFFQSRKKYQKCNNKIGLCIRSGLDHFYPVDFWL